MINLDETKSTDNVQIVEKAIWLKKTTAYTYRRNTIGKENYKHISRNSCIPMKCKVYDTYKMKFQ